VNNFISQKKRLEDWKQNNNPETLPQSLNDDILCLHGGLTPAKEELFLVSKEAFDLIVLLFPGTIQLSTKQVEYCFLCEELMKDELEYKNAIESQRQTEKSLLTELYQHKTKKNYPLEIGYWYLISITWVQSWWRYIDSWCASPPGPVDNRNLFCGHKKFSYPITCTNDRYVLIPEKTWQDAVRLYQVVDSEQVIRIRCHEPNSVAEIVPGLCDSCINADEKVHITLIFNEMSYNIRYPLDTFDSVHVEDFKNVVKERLNIHSDTLQLWVGDIPMEVNLPLRDYGVQSGTVLIFKEEVIKEIGFEGTTLQRGINNV